jgi:hypothetical protein|tara:strand:- start:347 stop:613 length:267 start_codon:yes stop_codon:yes gene_type:complete
MAEVTRVGHSDAGHGWLAVKLADLKMLGIESDITDFSYIKGKTAYLEEDKDATTYINAMKAKGINVVVRHGPPRDRSPIRSFKRYEPA